jgi:steroid 5-alpha reductase family enzyme
MNGLPAALASSSTVIATAMLLLWFASLRLRDASIVDVFWGTGFAVAAWTAALATGALALDRPRALAALGAVTVWGLRLSWHLFGRNVGHGEDRRYQAMRASHGERFGIVSLFTVFLLQGALVVLVSLPVQAAVAAPPAALGGLDLAGLALFAAGFLFEAVGDAQLQRFKADPASRGQVMDRGLWRYTRHPNYFGDAVLWWGLGLLGAAAGAPWTLVSPAIMTFLLVRVSGVALLERDIGDRRPGYRAYVARTSAFVPWLPRRALPDGDRA